VTAAPAEAVGASTGEGAPGEFPLVFGLDTFGDVTHDEDDRPLSHAQTTGTSSSKASLPTRSASTSLESVNTKAHDLPGEPERVPRYRRGAEADRDAAQHCLRSGPVGDIARRIPVGREDVHEDVGRALRLRVVAIVVCGHEVAARDRAGDDHGRGRLLARSTGWRWWLCRECGGCRSCWWSQRGVASISASTTSASSPQTSRTGSPSALESAMPRRAGERLTGFRRVQA
jgi:hypothetical protein